MTKPNTHRWRRGLKGSNGRCSEATPLPYGLYHFLNSRHFWRLFTYSTSTVTVQVGSQACFKTVRERFASHSSWCSINWVCASRKRGSFSSILSTNRVFWSWQWPWSSCRLEVATAVGNRFYMVYFDYVAVPEDESTPHNVTFLSVQQNNQSMTSRFRVSRWPVFPISIFFLVPSGPASPFGRAFTAFTFTCLWIGIF